MKRRLNYVPAPLVFLALALDRSWLAWINALCLWIIKLLFLPLLTLSLRLRFRNLQSLKLSIRQSGRNWKDYNFLFSDIDLYILVSDFDFENQIRSLAKYLEAVREYFIFLGEIEIYRNSEYHELETLLQNSRLYHSLRDVRKLGWLSRQFPNLPSRFHRERALRAMRKCHERLGINWADNQTETDFDSISKFLYHLLDLTVPISGMGPIDEFCPYMGFQIKTAEANHSHSDKNQLYLSTEVALSLLACCPPKNRGPAIRQAIFDLRVQSKFHKQAFCELSRLEFLTVTGVNRGIFIPEPAMIEWQHLLKDSCPKE